MSLKSSSNNKWIYRDIDVYIGAEIQKGKGYARLGEMKVHLKQYSPDPDDCYEMFNEAVSVSLGHMCGLPVLEQFFFLHGTNIYSVTQYISQHGHPPLKADNLRKMLYANPSMSHGMVMFDLWIANNDRKPDNIQFGPNADSIYLIDFGNALLYRAETKGVKRLEEMEKYPEKLYTEPGKPYAYTKLLYDPGEVDFWCDRFLSIPEWMIRNAVERGDEVLQMGSTVWESSEGSIKEAAYNFLIKRRNLLKRIVTKLAKEGIFSEYKPQSDAEEIDTDNKGAKNND
jgi:serine/threonine protein kinase